MSVAAAAAVGAAGAACGCEFQSLEHDANYTYPLFKGHKNGHKFGAETRAGGAYAGTREARRGIRHQS